MPILIYNTLSRKKEEFISINKNHVKMYVCGVTPYDEVHLGHARAYVTFDIVRRHLENSGYKVTHIQNFTDVDDKIIARAKETGVSPLILAQKFVDNYFEQMDKLKIKRAADYPRVTGNIPQIITFVKKLVEKKYAYVKEHGVYFEVNKFKDYGKLSKRNIDEQKSGARVEIDDKKNNPIDFALWKRSKPDEPQEVSWDSPWGKGRPGWHIECSVMSTNILGETFDIHGGGQDLIFPHHENEIAQSEAATGKPFAKYWIHNGFVTINKEKMSKSLGNFFTLSDIYKKYEPRVVRYFLLSQHYRMPLDFSDDKLKQAQASLKGLDEAWRLMEQKHKDDSDNKDSQIAIAKDALKSFQDALDDDFNTEKALAAVHSFKSKIMTHISLNSANPASDIGVYKETYKKIIENYLGISLTINNSIPENVSTLLIARQKARKEKNWQEADRTRNELDKLGYKAMDNPDGTSTGVKK